MATKISNKKEASTYAAARDGPAVMEARNLAVRNRGAARTDQTYQQDGTKHGLS